MDKSAILQRAKELGISATKNKNYFFGANYGSSSKKTLKDLRDFVDSVKHLPDSCRVVADDDLTFSNIDAERGISVQEIVDRSIEEIDDHIAAVERLRKQNEDFDLKLLKRLKEKYESGNSK